MEPVMELVTSRSKKGWGRIVSRIGLEPQKLLKPHHVGNGRHWQLTYFLCPFCEITHDGENELVSLFGLLCSSQSELQI